MCGAGVRGEGVTFLLALAQMEKYSKHLEVLVAERTQELIAEQKKTDSLLYSESHLNCAGQVVVDAGVRCQGLAFTVCIHLQVCCRSQLPTVSDKGSPPMHSPTSARPSSSG